MVRAPDRYYGRSWVRFPPGSQNLSLSYARDKLTNSIFLKNKDVDQLFQPRSHLCNICGQSKPPKHILLSYGVKTLTENVELIQMLNRLGHGVSFSQLEKMTERYAYRRGFFQGLFNLTCSLTWRGITSTGQREQLTVLMESL